jgi:hypothetical protein
VGNELLRLEVDGTSVLMETDEDFTGWTPAASFGERAVHDAKVRFEDALSHVSHAAQAALRTFREGADKSAWPDEVEIEFGVKFGAEAGAVIAKTSLEGQFTVKVKWAASKPAPGVSVDGR